MGLQEGIRLLYYLDKWPVFAELIPRLLELCELLFQLCKDLGIVINLEKPDLKPNSNAQYLRMLIDTIRERVYPMDFQNTRFREVADQFLLHVSPPAKIVAADPRPHSISGGVYSQGNGQDVTPLVAAEVILVGISGWPSDTSPSSRRLAGSVSGGSCRRSGGHQDSSSKCHLRLLSCSQTGWGVHL